MITNTSSLSEDAPLLRSTQDSALAYSSRIAQFLLADLTLISFSQFIALAIAIEKSNYIPTYGPQTSSNPDGAA